MADTPIAPAAGALVGTGVALSALSIALGPRIEVQTGVRVVPVETLVSNESSPYPLTFAQVVANYAPTTRKSIMTSDQGLITWNPDLMKWIEGVGAAEQDLVVVVPLTGFTIQIGNYTSTLVLNPSGTLAAGSIILPGRPPKGGIVRVTSSQAVSALTLQASLPSQTIIDAPTALVLGVGFGYIYSASDTTWYRLY